VASFTRRVAGDGAVSWRVQIRIRGHKPVAKTFARKTDAKRWATRTESDVRSGLYLRTRESEKRTLGDLIERYKGKRLAALASSANVAAQLDRWAAELGHMRLCDVTPAVVADVRDKLAGETTVRGTLRSPARVNRYLAALSSAFQLGLKELGWVDDTPMRQVSKLKEPRGRVRFLSAGELARLSDACRESNCAPLYSVFLLAVSTGMRKGEVMGLRWADVDLKGGWASLAKTKNGEPREVRIAGEALDLLRAHAKVRRLDSDYVFPSHNGRKPLDIRKPWTLAVEAAELSDFRFHDLRHTAASYMHMSGAAQKDIAEVLGHKTLAMTNRYTHLTRERIAETTERMTAQFFPSRRGAK